MTPLQELDQALTKLIQEQAEILRVQGWRRDPGLVVRRLLIEESATAAAQGKPGKEVCLSPVLAALLHHHATLEGYSLLQEERILGMKLTETGPGESCII